MMSSLAQNLLTLALGAAILAASLAVPSKPADKSEAQSAVNETSDVTASGVNSTDDDVQYPFRDLPADVLRDFPGFCFGSTALRLFKVRQSWSLTPFCGVATCLVSEDGFHLVERVQDCGPQPKRNPKCHNTNARSEEAFPACCPKYECEEGASLEYPTEEELASLAQEAAQEAVRAQYEDEDDAESPRSGRKTSEEAEPTEATAEETTATTAAAAN